VKGKLSLKAISQHKDHQSIYCSNIKNSQPKFCKTTKNAKICNLLPLIITTFPIKQEREIEPTKTTKTHVYIHAPSESEENHNNKV